LTNEERILLIRAKILRQMVDGLEDHPSWGPGSNGRIIALKNAVANFIQHIDKMKEQFDQ